jgi:hypothetical protein
MASTKVYCPLHKNFLHYKHFLQVPRLTTQSPKITRKSLQGGECLEEEAKVCFISLAPRFYFSVLPFSVAPGPP